LLDFAEAALVGFVVEGLPLLDREGVAQALLLASGGFKPVHGIRPDQEPSPDDDHHEQQREQQRAYRRGGAGDVLQVKIVEIGEVHGFAPFAFSGFSLPGQFHVQRKLVDPQRADLSGFHFHKGRLVEDGGLLQGAHERGHPRAGLGHSRTPPPRPPPA
jgi:hypothetical protein